MRTIAALPLIAAAATLLLLACDGDKAPLTSGIEGQVLLGPSCPVVQEGTPCPDQPYKASIVVWDSEQTQRLHVFTTDDEGRFRVPLAPGDYYLEPQPPEGGGPPTPIPQTVTVQADRFLQVTIEFDSGIR